MLPLPIRNICSRLLYEKGLISEVGSSSFSNNLEYLPIAADGSLRNFFRVGRSGAPLCVGVFPQQDAAEGHAEANSAYKIGNYLYQKTLPVPEILGWDEETGLIIFEDCGDMRLHDLVLQDRSQGEAKIGDETKRTYFELVTQLCQMQIQGAEGFDISWCYDTPYYDREIMINREAEYYHKAFLCGLLGKEPVCGLAEEFEDIAENAGNGFNDYFLHRDFQSRNIMIKSGGIRVIDFQGGRIGPLGYDLASLLMDPYTSLDESLKEDLFDHYRSELAKYISYNDSDFKKQYDYLSLLRNLQIVGAFSFLYKNRGKPFFKIFILPALKELEIKISSQRFNQYTVLRKMVNQSQELAVSVLGK